METISIKDEIKKQNFSVLEKVNPKNKDTVKLMISKYDSMHSLLALVNENFNKPCLLEKIKEALNEREKNLFFMTTYL
jgi:uncharacterized protein YpiB (UPF0302 family)